MKLSRHEAMALTFWWGVLVWLLSGVAALASVWLYFQDQTLKAIYWLLVAVLLHRYGGGVLDRLHQQEEKGP